MRYIAYTAAAIVVVLVLFFVLSVGYIAHGVDATEIGVRFERGVITDIVGPGVYTKVALFAEMKDIELKGVPFAVFDQEVLTQDKQRIGLRVTGTVHRPGLEKTDFVREHWKDYSTFWLSDQALVGQLDQAGNIQVRGLMQELGQQALKVCVGEKPFDQAVVGEARDALRECIDSELDGLANVYGLDIRNLVVPDVVISPEVQKQLDAITEAKFARDIAIQQEQRAIAEANKTLAEQQGAIRVEQGRVQEKAKQDAITAELQTRALEQQKGVIEAQKANDLRAAELDLAIAKAQKAAAAETAQADLAKQVATAAMYQNAPEYVRLLIAQAMAQAYKETDKVILPAGTDPLMVLGGQEVILNPSTNTAPPTPQQ